MRQWTPPAPEIVIALKVQGMLPLAASTIWNKPFDSLMNATSPTTTKPESAGCGTVICQAIVAGYLRQDRRS